DESENSFRTIEVERLKADEFFVVPSFATGIYLMEFSASAIVAVCVSRAAVILSATSFLMAT
nr:hypothetical protein [Tanacetum cinerariifolium]